MLLVFVTLALEKLVGKLYLVLPKYRAVIWVHGCFWHDHQCPAGKLPETRVSPGTIRLVVIRPRH